MLRTRGFLHLTYKLYHHLDKLGERKATCLCVYLAILKYAWKKNNYQCDLRYSTLEKDTKLSRSTVRRCIDTLETMNVIKSIKGRSGKTYVVNAKFLKAETEYMGIKEHPMSIKEHSDGNKRTVLVEEVYINTYYIKLAIARKEELAAESKANYVNPNVIIKELTKIKKMSNPRYREKVEYNKRNNLDWKGNAKDKD